MVKELLESAVCLAAESKFLSDTPKYASSAAGSLATGNALNSASFDTHSFYNDLFTHIEYGVYGLTEAIAGL